MDQFDTTSMLFNKIKNMDPENASKIMGYILIQDLNEKDLVYLAFGPETVLQSLIFKAKLHLGLSSNSLSTPPPPHHHHQQPIARLNSNSTHNNIKNYPFAQISPRVTNNGFPDPKSSPFLSFDNIRSGSSLVPSHHLDNDVVVPAGAGGGDSGNNGSAGNDFLPEDRHFNDFFSFLNESSKNEEFIDPRSSQLSSEVSSWGQDLSNGDTHLHRRRFSASDACFGTDDAVATSVGFVGYRPCVYFARGFCKNGDNCKFLHADFGDNVDVNGGVVGSPSKIDGLYLQHEEMVRMKAAHQQRLAASQFTAGVSPLPYDKCMNFLLQQQNDPQRAAAAALMLGDEFYKFGHGRQERSDFLAMGLTDKGSSVNRQIYLTFPADSTFKDEDVSNYFSLFGPVQDVRIPYQQKRMFGFVTFVYPETVKLILARGNPHFICDSRVLVKPYKEKGKVLDKRQQQFDRGNFSPCSSPSGVDPRDMYDLHLGAKMLFNTQEVMMRRKLEEQAELQQAIEFQRQRLMHLQMPDLKHHQRSLSVGSPVSLSAHIDVNQNVILPSDGINEEVSEGDNSTGNFPLTTTAATENHPQQEVNAAFIKRNSIGDSKDESSNPEGVQHVLPNCLFASPMKKSAEGQTSDSSSTAKVSESITILATSSSPESNLEMPTTTTGMASCET